MNYRIGVLCLMMVLIVGMRAIAPLSENFVYIASITGIGAVALFGGAYFKNVYQSMVLPLALLFLSDLALVFTMGLDYAFNTSTPFIYGSFLLITLVGRWMLKNVNVKNVLLANLVGVFIHWIVTDFEVWYLNPAFSQDLAGYWQVLLLAIPFERTFLVSTLVTSAILFGSFEWMKSKYPKIAFSGIK